MSQLVFETTEIIMQAIEKNGELLDHIKVVMPSNTELIISLQNQIILLGKNRNEIAHLHPGVSCDDLACGF